MDALLYLTGISIILIIGIFATVFSNKLKIANVLPLLLVGIALSGAGELFTFSETFLLAMAIITLVMVVFEGSSKLKLKELDSLSNDALRLIIVFVLLNLVIMTVFTFLLFFATGTFSWANILASAIFSIAMTSTDAGAVMVMYKNASGYRLNHILKRIQMESVVNTPILFILVFILLDLITAMGNKGQLSLLIVGTVLAKQIIIGLGTGLVIGIVIFKIMKKIYSSQLSPIGMIGAILIAYVLSENLGGDGVLSVATLGIFYGAVTLRQKETLSFFSTTLSNFFEIFVFVFLGLIIKIPLTLEFFLKSLLLFMVLLVVRYISVRISYKKHNLTKKEMLFISTSMPKGITTAVLTFSFMILGFSGVDQIISLMFASIIYSVILSTIVQKLSGKLIVEEHHEKTAEKDHVAS